MRLAVIGAGWAGLSAAVQAADLGHDTTVFEASHTLGGRARAVVSPRLHTRIDNGQHIMLGAYKNTLALIQRLGIDADKALQREPLTLESADGAFRLQVSRLPAPFHLLGALLSARGLFLRDKWKLAQAIHRLQREQWQVTPGMTVQQWLDQHSQSIRVRTLFWHPLCVAALNTPVAQACAQLFANVLRDSLGSTPDACDIVLSRVDLSSLWPDHVEQPAMREGHGSVTIRRGAAVTRLALAGDPLLADSSRAHDTPHAQGVLLNDERFDAVIIACNVPSAQRLLKQLPDTHTQSISGRTLLHTLSRFTYVPIATLTLRLATPWNLPRSMYLLHENRAAKHYGQWLFNCPAFMDRGPASQEQESSTDTTATAASLIQIVISDASAALEEDPADLVEAIQAQLQTQARRFGIMPAVTGYELIAEKRATFAATPNLSRPGTSTPWPQVWLAGDWTDTGYPAVLEGAVRSGQQAAICMHRILG